MNKWDKEIDGFKEHLTLIGRSKSIGDKKEISKNTINAYITDLRKLTTFLDEKGYDLEPKDVQLKHLREMMEWITEKEISPRTQARIISGIRTFYKYLIYEEITDNDPTQLLELPKIGRKLPEVLSVEEIDMLINSIDTKKVEGQRNRTILEILYSCGLRVSEIIDLKISDLFLIDGFIKVTNGKGSKERLVPIGKRAISELNLYINGYRKQLDDNKTIKQSCKETIFVNRRGSKLSRVMVFTIIKQAARKCRLSKTISPHTLRHSFATHLINGGANLEDVRKMLGHKSINTTEIYTHLDNNYLRETINNFHPRA